ncbi:MAG: hypothetical protein ACJZ2K_05765, partial [Candidatus Poseidoniaceae archaeon]
MDCVYCLEGKAHACLENNILTEEMVDFGITHKFIQSDPKVEEQRWPYWGSSHQYDKDVEKWGKTEIKISSFEQSGITHYFGIIPLGIADAVCKVPALPAAADTLEICKRSIENDVTDQYQRPLQFRRLGNLNSYLSGEPTIVNPIILDIPKESVENGSIKIEKNKLLIDLQCIDFFKKNLKDVEGGQREDYRPLHLVDGQHRVRSSRLETNALSLNIPFVLVGDNYEGGGGRIFAEINVQNEDLNPLHKLHLRYVLSLSSHKPENDFGPVSECFLDDPLDEDTEDYNIMKNRFANRVAYRIGAKICSNKLSPLYKLIQYYGEAKGTAISAGKWVSICSQWATQNINLASNEDFFIKVVTSYFEAWESTANFDPVTNQRYDDCEENNRWGSFVNKITGRQNQTILFNDVWFESIMELFPQCFKISKINESHNPSQMVEIFSEILKPCQPIDGTDLDAWDEMKNASGRYEPKHLHIYWWMSWAINDYYRTGNLAKPEDAWNISDSKAEIPSVAGKGFFSPVNRELFTGVLEVKNVPLFGNEIEGMSIKVTAEAFANESMPKEIKFTCFPPNTTVFNNPPRQKSTNVRPTVKRIGINQRWELFGKKSFPVGYVKIEVRSGNLFNQGSTDEIFSQIYTLEELRKFDGFKTMLSNIKPNLNLHLEKHYKEIETENNSNTTHLVFDPEEDEERSSPAPIVNTNDGDSPGSSAAISEEDDEDEWLETEEMYSGPPSRNSYSTTKSDHKWRNEAYP